MVSTNTAVESVTVQVCLNASFYCNCQCHCKGKAVCHMDHSVNMMSGLRERRDAVDIIGEESDAAATSTVPTTEEKEIAERHFKKWLEELDPFFTMTDPDDEQVKLHIQHLERLLAPAVLIFDHLEKWQDQYPEKAASLCYWVQATDIKFASPHEKLFKKSLTMMLKCERKDGDKL